MDLRLRASSVAIALGLLALNPLSSADEAARAPETVEIHALGDWFGPTRLEHALHAEISDDCESCHHNSDGEAVLCATCHEAAAGQLAADLPSLEQAFHRNCMGCHEGVDGPTGCTDCHARARLPEGPPLGETKTS